MYVNLSDNPPNWTNRQPVLRCPDGVKPKFKKLITFAVPSLAVLLNQGLAWTFDLYSITDRTVCNKIANIGLLSGCF